MYFEMEKLREFRDFEYTKLPLAEYHLVNENHRTFPLNNPAVMCGIENEAQ